MRLTLVKILHRPVLLFQPSATPHISAKGGKMSVNSRNLTKAQPAGHPWWRRILAPTTKAGWWSAAGVLGFMLTFGIFQLLIISGQRGGATFFANLWLAIPFVSAALAAVAGGVAAFVAIFRHRERSLLTIIALLWGIIVFLFMVLEIAFPH